MRMRQRVRVSPYANIKFYIKETAVAVRAYFSFALFIVHIFANTLLSRFTIPLCLWHPLFLNHLLHQLNYRLSKLVILLVRLAV